MEMARKSTKWRVILGVASVVLAAAGFAGARWWRDRPLAGARAAYARGEWNLALGLAQSELARDQRTGPKLIIARSLSQLSQFEQADAFFRRIPPNELAAGDLRLWGQALMQLHWWPQAMDVYNELHRRQPGDPVALQTLAVLDFQVGKGDEALALAGQLAKIRDREAPALCIQGAIYESLGDSDKAADLMSRVLTLDPSGQTLPIPIAQVRQKLISNLFSAGRLDDAQRLLEDSIANDPSPELMSMLGSIFFKKGEADTAREQWYAALHGDEHNVRSILGLGELAMVERQPAEAVEWLQMAKEFGAGGSSLEYKLSIAYRQAGRADLAERHAAEYQRLVEVGDRQEKENRSIFGNPQAPQTLCLLARHALRVGDVLEAEGHLKELQRIFPGYPEAATLWAEVQAQRARGSGRASPTPGAAD
jgi:tetratricopeptide (TPR) repeat protein